VGPGLQVRVAQGELDGSRLPGGGSQAGFDAHMTKPVDLHKLSATVDELLQRKRS
jgi:hypothetical protein